MKIRASLMLAVVAVYLPTAMARPHQPIDSIDALDEQIQITLRYLAQGQLDEAGLLARQMAWRFPTFELGQLISAEMESVRAQRDVAIADNLPLAPGISELLLEARQRLAAKRTDNAHRALPGDLIQIGTHISNILHVDLNASVLSQYKVHSRRPVLVRQHYVGSGEGGFGKQIEGDLKTPLGVYNITGVRSDKSLPDLYGSGALTLDYPNALDRKMGRTGYGIWLHGVPSRQTNRAPYSSEGCVTMSNEHLSRLTKELNPSTTKVILSNNAAAINSEKRRTLQLTFRQLFKKYRHAHASGNKEQLSQLYNNPDMNAHNPASGNGHLKRVSRQEPSSELFNKLSNNQLFSEVEPDNISIFRHPDISSLDASFESLVVTEAIFGDLNEYQLTIFWAQGHQGQWQILTETLLGPGM